MQQQQKNIPPNPLWNMLDFHGKNVQGGEGGKLCKRGEKEFGEGREGQV